MRQSTMLTVKFNLAFATRHDEQANVFVGYCPVLKVHSQGRTDEEAREAVVDAARLFILTCYKRNILYKYLRSRGMTEAITPPENEDHQYIRIEHYDNQFEREVPIEILAAQNAEAIAACAR
jgi:predicted RNase H-like HicB family nuclease